MMVRIVPKLQILFFSAVICHTTVDFDNYFEIIHQLSWLKPINGSALCPTMETRHQGLEQEYKNVYLKMKQKISETEPEKRPEMWLTFLTKLCKYVRRDLEEGSNDCLSPLTHNNTHVFGMERQELVDKIGYVSDFIDETLTLIVDVLTAAFEILTEEIRNERTDTDDCIRIAEKEVEMEIGSKVSGKMESVKDMDRIKKEIAKQQEGELQMDTIRRFLQGGAYFVTANCGFPTDMLTPEFKARFLKLCDSDDRPILTDTHISNYNRPVVINLELDPNYHRTLEELNNE